MRKENKRRHVRLRAHHLIKYKVIERGQAESVHPFVKEISAGGILFYTGEHIPKNSILEVKINIPLAPQLFEAKCRVVRALPSKDGGFDIGVEFTEVDTEMQKFLNERIIQSYKEGRGG